MHKITKVIDANPTPENVPVTLRDAVARGADTVEGKEMKDRVSKDLAHEREKKAKPKADTKPKSSTPYKPNGDAFHSKAEGPPVSIVVEGTKLMIITLNVLSLLLGNDGYSVDNFGEARTWDNEERIKACVQYMTERIHEHSDCFVVFCLQETVWAFITNPLVVEFCNTYGFDRFSHYFGYRKLTSNSKEERAPKLLTLQAVMADLHGVPSDDCPVAAVGGRAENEDAGDESKVDGAKTEEAREDIAKDDGDKPQTPKKKEYSGVNKLGLAIFVPKWVSSVDDRESPTPIISVFLNKLLFPWKTPFIPVDVAYSLKYLSDKLAGVKSLLPWVNISMQRGTFDASVLGDCCKEYGLDSKFTEPSFYEAPHMESMEAVQWEAQCYTNCLHNPNTTKTSWQSLFFSEQMSQLYKAIQQLIDNYSGEFNKLYETIKSNTPFPDRSVIVLGLDIGGKRVFVVTCHMPCVHQDPRMMNLLMFKVMRELHENIISNPEYADVPIIFTGDMNSVPTQTGNAYSLVTGALAYGDPLCPVKYVTADEFQAFVTGNIFTDVCAHIENRATCCGLTKPNYKTFKKGGAQSFYRVGGNGEGVSFYTKEEYDKLVSEGCLSSVELLEYQTRESLCLDYIFKKDPQDKLEVCAVECPTEPEVFKKFGYTPLPCMEIPRSGVLPESYQANATWHSDHLPVWAKFILK